MAEIAVRTRFNIGQKAKSKRLGVVGKIWKIELRHTIHERGDTHSLFYFLSEVRRNGGGLSQRTKMI